MDANSSYEAMHDIVEQAKEGTKGNNENMITGYDRYI